jgi:hypothetical protein
MLIVDKAIYQAEDAASDKVNLNQDKAETQIKLMDFYIFVSSYHLTTTEYLLNCIEKTFWFGNNLA